MMSGSIQLESRFLSESKFLKAFFVFSFTILVLSLTACQTPSEPSQLETTPILQTQAPIAANPVLRERPNSEYKKEQTHQQLAMRRGHSFESLAEGPREAALFLKVLSDDAFSLLADPDLSEQVRRGRFRLLFEDAFDLKMIAQYVLDKNWEKANGVQRRLFVQLYSDLMVNSYAARFRNYSSRHFQIIGARSSDPQMQLVRTMVTDRNGRALEVDWQVRDVDFDHQVLDVMVEGVSLALTHRDEYESIISQSGMDGLLALLKIKVAKLENG